MSKKIIIIHENKDWLAPITKAFERANLEWEEIYLTSGSIDLSTLSKEAIYWSRLSASAHTRAHEHSKDYGRALLAYLEAQGRRVVNGVRVLELEVSKVAQYLALSKFGFRVPHTIAIFGKADLLNRAKAFKTPFITKHNQGGKGLGVRLFASFKEFESYVNSSEFEEANDGITLLQEYIKAKNPFITRLEFVGGRFCYAVRVDTSDGGFELCPAESCEIERTPKLAVAACDIGAKFSLREDISPKDPLVTKLEGFLQAQGIEIAGIEFIDTGKELVIYDINTNTNYNKEVEESLRKKGKNGAADEVASFLKGLL